MRKRASGNVRKQTEQHRDPACIGVHNQTASQLVVHVRTHHLQSAWSDFTECCISEASLTQTGLCAPFDLDIKDAHTNVTPVGNLKLSSETL